VSAAVTRATVANCRIAARDSACFIWVEQPSRQRDGCTQTVKAVSKLIANIIGAVAAITYVGFLAYKVGALPLIIVVVLCLGLMVYSFYDDMRNDRTIARIRSENHTTQ